MAKNTTWYAKDREVSRTKISLCPLLPLCTPQRQREIAYILFHKTRNLPGAKNGLQSSMKFEKHCWCKNKSSFLLPSLVCNQCTMTTATNNRHPPKSKSIQIVTTNDASSNCSCSRSHQWFFHYSYKHDELKHPTNRYPTSARKTRCPPWKALDLQDGYPPQALNYIM